MADLDELSVCADCLHPVEGMERCPCGGELKRCSALMLGAVRTLKAKGWPLVGWSERREGDWFEMRLDFKGFAPDVMGRFSNLPDRWRVKPELPQYGSPSVLVREKSELEAARFLTQWANETKRFSLPFAVSICDKCREQGADWFFSACKCPTAGGWVWFYEGLPERCAYAAEQVVTRPERMERAVKEFEGMPFVVRALRRPI